MTYHADGFVQGHNPSYTGGGFTVCDETGEVVMHKQIMKYGFTNNEGELLGVLHAAMLASHGDTIITDSMNTIRWIKSGNPKARPDLKEQCQLAKETIEFKGLKLTWRPRHENLAGQFNEKPKVWTF